jgi:hypothetical protein
LQSPQATNPYASLYTTAAATGPVPQALVNQVNLAANSNPILANLISLAITEKASPDQLKTLGLLIQTLANTTGVPYGTNIVPTVSTSTSTGTTSAVVASSAGGTAGVAAPSIAAETVTSALTPSDPTQPSPPPPPPQKDFDIIIEFSEAPQDRWLLPRGPVVVEKIDNPAFQFASFAPTVTDILLTTRIPFPEAKDSVRNAAAPTPTWESLNGEVPPQLVQLKLRRAPMVIWEMLVRWIGGEAKMKENRKILDKLKKVETVYLGYQLTEGPLLTQLQTVCPIATCFISPGSFKPTDH